jgi:hypothetical protein
MRSPRLRAVLAAIHWGRCTRLALPHASSITRESPGVVARILPMFESKVLRRSARIMRQCCEAAMARVNTSLTVAFASRRSRREMRDDAVLTLRVLQGSADFEEQRPFGSGRCPARLLQPAGLAFRAAKLSINAEIRGSGTTTR